MFCLANRALGENTTHTDMGWLGTHINKTIVFAVYCENPLSCHIPLCQIAVNRITKQC